MAVKRCVSCREELDVSQFWKNARRPDGLTPACIPCRKAQRLRLRGRPMGSAVARFPSLVAPHDRIVTWAGGPTRITVHGVSDYGGEHRAVVSEHGRAGRRDRFYIPCRWLLLNSKPVTA